MSLGGGTESDGRYVVTTPPGCESGGALAVHRWPRARTALELPEARSSSVGHGESLGRDDRVDVFDLGFFWARTARCCLSSSLSAPPQYVETRKQSLNLQNNLIANAIKKEITTLEKF